MQQFLQKGEKEKNALVMSWLKIGIADEKNWPIIKIYLISRGAHPKGVSHYLSCHVH